MWIFHFRPVIVTLTKRWPYILIISNWKNSHLSDLNSSESILSNKHSFQLENVAKSLVPVTKNILINIHISPFIAIFGRSISECSFSSRRYRHDDDDGVCMWIYQFSERCTLHYWSRVVLLWSTILVWWYYWGNMLSSWAEHE